MSKDIMTTDFLSLEQVRFIAATVSPYFGPMIDNAARRSFLSNREQTLARAAAALEASDDLMKLIVSEVDGDQEFANPWTTKFRALAICQQTFAQHDPDEITGIVIEELCRHSVSLRDAEQGAGQ